MMSIGYGQLNIGDALNSRCEEKVCSAFSDYVMGRLPRLDKN
jgi:hypothetical protein